MSYPQPPTGQYPQPPVYGQQSQQYPPNPYGPPPQQGYGPPQGYAPPNPYGQPPQGYQQPYGPPQGQQYPPQATPEPPRIPGTLDGFLTQPSAGGGAPLKFEKNGDAYLGIVSRALTDGDVDQQMTLGQNPQPATYKDGRAKLVLRVPLNVAPSQNNSDGRAQWYCRGGARDMLVAAMQSVGAPNPGIPEMGSAIYVALTGTRPAGQGMNPAKVYDVRYYRPEQAREIATQAGIEYPNPPTVPDNPGQDDGPPVPPPNPGLPPQTPQTPAPQQAAPQYPGAPDGAYGYAPNGGAVVPGGYPAQAPQQAPVPPQNGQPYPPQPQGSPGYVPQMAPPVNGQPPAGMTDENAALLAQMAAYGQQ